MFDWDLVGIGTDGRGAGPAAAEAKVGGGFGWAEGCAGARARGTKFGICCLALLVFIVMDLSSFSLILTA